MRKKLDAEKADIAIAEAAAPLGETAPIRALGWVSEVADQPPLISICAALCAGGLLLGDRRLARTGARMLAAELLATKLKGMVKHRIDRTRPFAVAAGKAYQAEAGNSHESALSSFPSGHTAGAVAVARAFVREHPAQTVAAYSAAAAIGAIQIPRSKHFVSDVGAGAVIGLVAEEAVHLTERLMRHIWRTRGR